MRLLDHVAQCTAPFVVRQQDGATWRLAGASDFAVPVARCPLRYVLADDLLSTCIELAYSEGDELAGCLDLLHIPAEQLWIEWNETARREELRHALPHCQPTGDPNVLRAGTLITADPGGRSGRLRTFWMTRNNPYEPQLAAVETLIDLDHGVTRTAAAALLDGATVALRDSRCDQVDDLLQHAGFRLDPTWQRYYHTFVDTAETREQVIHQSLAGVAFDVPILLALFLLLSIRTSLVQKPVDPMRLNAKRMRLGKRPLLEHIEVSCPLFGDASLRHKDNASGLRRGPRFHHVRGHLVRRRNIVYWRGPHWRGHVRLGSVRSRTVELRLPS